MLPVCGGANINSTLLTVRFKLVCQSHIITKEAISRHLSSNYPGQYRPTVDTDTHLKKKHVQLKLSYWE